MTDEEKKKLENKPVSKALQEKKEGWYDKIPLSVKAMDIILIVAFVALAIVIVLITLEALGIFAL